jgi:hypothetical protein
VLPPDVDPPVPVEPPDGGVYQPEPPLFGSTGFAPVLEFS